MQAMQDYIDAYIARREQLSLLLEKNNNTVTDILVTDPRDIINFKVSKLDRFVLVSKLINCYLEISPLKFFIVYERVYHLVYKLLTLMD